jgi:hypothetical protein
MLIATIIAVLMQATSSWAYVNVRGYIKSNGTIVAPYIRTSPNAYRWDNFSSRLESGMQPNHTGFSTPQFDRMPTPTVPYNPRSMMEIRYNG